MSGLWWENFASEWNAFSGKEGLAGLGCIGIITTDGGVVATLHFDHNGTLAIKEPYDESIPSFSALKEIWWKFICGNFYAADAILDGRIRFTGTLSQIVPYIREFDLLNTFTRTDNIYIAKS
jgi:hypothetical protein